MAGKIQCIQRRKRTAVELLGVLSVVRQSCGLQGTQSDSHQPLKRSMGKDEISLLGGTGIQGPSACTSKPY